MVQHCVIFDSLLVSLNIHHINPKFKKMNTHISFVMTLLLAIVILPPHARAQADPIEQIFDTYSADDNFTFVNISGQMLQLISGRRDIHVDRDEGGPGIISRLERIRILSSSNLDDESVTSAFHQLRENLTRMNYDELMEIRDAGSHFRFLMTGDIDRVKQLVLVGHDKNSHVLISIEGDLTLSEMRLISNMVPGLEGLRHIRRPGN